MSITPPPGVLVLHYPSTDIAKHTVGQLLKAKLCSKGMGGRGGGGTASVLSETRQDSCSCHRSGKWCAPSQPASRHDTRQSRSARGRSTRAGRELNRAARMHAKTWGPQHRRKSFSVGSLVNRPAPPWQLLIPGCFVTMETGCVAIDAVREKERERLTERERLSYIASMIYRFSLTRFKKPGDKRYFWISSCAMTLAVASCSLYYVCVYTPK